MVNARNIPKLPLEQAAALLIKIGITQSVEFYKLYKKSKIPKIIPGDPKSYYAEYRDWNSFMKKGEAFLEDGKQPEERMPTYSELKNLVDRHSISSRVVYNEAVKEGKLGILAPARPDIVFPEEFTTWSRFLANPTASRFVTYEEAKKKMRALGIRHSVDWQNLCAAGKRPPDLPFQPSKVYPEWKGWKEFLK